MTDDQLSLWDWLRLESKTPKAKRSLRMAGAAVLALLGGLALIVEWTNGNGILLLLGAAVLAWLGLRIPVPPEPEPDMALEGEAEKPGEPLPAATDGAADAPLARRTGSLGADLRWPAAVLLALAAQWLKDAHPFGMDESQPIGWLLYLGALALAVWALLARDVTFPFQPPRLMEGGVVLPDLRPMRLTFLAGSIIFLLISFFSFVDTFEAFPLLFLVMGILYWLMALGQYNVDWNANLIPAWRSFRARLSDRLQADGGRVTISGWSVLVLVTFTLLAALRFYRIDAVPPEMTSDHIEKLKNVMGILEGNAEIFFGNNGGREPLQFYLIALFSQIFGTGISFTSLKLVSVLDGIAMLPVMYLLGKELAGRRTGWMAMVLTGIGYWPDLISRIGLRFPLAMLFTALTLYFFLRALRRREWNGFLWAGLALGVGLYGYTPIRIVPLAILLALACYLLHPDSKGARIWAVSGALVTGVTALLLFIPMIRYAMARPEEFWLRTVTRIIPEQGEVAEPAGVFIGNMLMGLRMFSENDGVGWFHLVPLRPALDVVCGALFHLGVVGAAVAFFRHRRWEHFFLVAAIPLLILPSVMALALPSENPSLTRASAVIPVVMVLAAMALDTVFRFLSERAPSVSGRAAAGLVAALLLAFSGAQSLDLTLRQFPNSYRLNCQNASELAVYLNKFSDSVGSIDDAHTVPFPYWVDGRAVSIYAGAPGHDYEVFREDLEGYDPRGRTTLFLLKTEDQESLAILKAMYPQASWKVVVSAFPGKDFIAFLIPAAGGEIAS